MSQNDTHSGVSPQTADTPARAAPHRAEIHFPLATWRKIRIYAMQRGMPASKLVRRAVREYMRLHPLPNETETGGEAS